MENANQTEQAHQKKAPSLKAFAASELAQSLENNYNAEEQISKLPEELQHFYSLMYKFNTISENLISAESAGNITQESLPLITEFQDRLLQAIESGLPHTEICINAIAQYFDVHENELTDPAKFVYHLKMTNFILQIFLTPEKMYSLITVFINEENPSMKHIKEVLNDFVTTAIQKDLTYVIQLLLLMNIFTKDQIIKLLNTMIYSFCSQEMIRTITEHSLTSKEIIEKVVQQGLLYNWINKDIDSIKLLFDKFEKFGLNVKEIVNINRYNIWQTWLNKAINFNRSKTVEFLLSKGADPSNCNALDWAIAAYQEMATNKAKSHQLPNSLKILKSVIQALLLNRSEVKE